MARIEPTPPEPAATPSTQTQGERPRGLVCRSCGCRHFYVVWVLPRADGSIRRRKACRNCGRRILTTER